jgi:hypothetical protein
VTTTIATVTRDAREARTLAHEVGRSALAMGVDRGAREGDRSQRAVGAEVKQSLACLALVSLVSCAANGADIDPAFTAHEREAIGAALQTWDDATPMWGARTSAKRIAFVRVDSLPGYARTVHGATRVTDFSDTVTVRLMPEASCDGLFLRLVTHELGHIVLGPAHIDSRASVLTSDVRNGLDAPSAEDIAAIAR